MCLPMGVKRPQMGFIFLVSDAIISSGIAWGFKKSISVFSAL